MKPLDLSTSCTKPGARDDTCTTSSAVNGRGTTGIGSSTPASSCWLGAGDASPPTPSAAAPLPNSISTNGSALSTRLAAKPCVREQNRKGWNHPVPSTLDGNTPPTHTPSTPPLRSTPPPALLGNALRGQLCQIDDGLSRDLPLSPATPRHHLSQGHSRLGQGYQTLFRPCNHMERVTVSRLLRSAAKYDATPCSERHPPCPITNR
eukprot:CAMPEP_0181325404 /NCGR_PEP_ID=MMETSP1101-20121128/20902_1 /TAXON_ID=46948 /ORGANISM="Rhodomonas abbreviata, Strain Caron Lab Isolate" /LENGTH=205 /DNA_ID=CAMNT_0023433699 /DNA_START=282 /DNA_END=898 /DNA_ORIENTATION=+